MNENEIKQALDQLAEFYNQRDALTLEKNRLLDEAMPQELKARMNEIEAEFAGKAEAVTENAARLEAEIKAAVSSVGASVKATFLHAVFAKGRVTWDSKGLEGVLITMPQLAKFRKEGEPSVSLRKI